MKLLARIAVLGVVSLAACSKPEPPSATSNQTNTTAGSASPMTNTTSVYDLKVTKLDGTAASLSEYKGKVALVVNTASECGYTPQYAGLEALWKAYKDKGLVVLGFPSNDFGGQEPGSSKDIQTFCSSKYGVTFPMFEKVKTKGDGRSELYKLLTDAAGEPKWNFHKYLVDKQGKVIAGYKSSVTPESDELKKAIDAALAK
ncbi:MAG: glutathione peroxidase [Deltaproteobacteria bacterium]|nr:glutathione peroxidase [Deltaproteobacteria bacterium]